MRWHIRDLLVLVAICAVNAALLRRIGVHAGIALAACLIPAGAIAYDRSHHGLGFAGGVAGGFYGGILGLACYLIRAYTVGPPIWDEGLGIVGSFLVMSPFAAILGVAFGLNTWAMSFSVSGIIDALVPTKASGGSRAAGP